jgi:hypothetical protein
MEEETVDTSVLKSFEDYRKFEVCMLEVLEFAVCSSPMIFLPGF